MKLKYLSYFLFLEGAVLLSGCKQEIDHPYEGKDRIQFQHYTTDWNGNRHYSDSTVYSFGLTPDTVVMDTLKLPVEYLGKGSALARDYEVSIVSDSTTANEDVHFLSFNHTQIFRADKLTDTLRIVILRKSLPNDYTTMENVQLVLKMEANENFDLGLKGGLYKRILLNNYMSEPKWWNGSLRGMFGFFHPAKWKFLIEKLDDEFATYGDIPYDINSPEVRSYYNSLDSYLRNTVVIDEKTGMRVTMRGLESIE